MLNLKVRAKFSFLSLIGLTIILNVGSVSAQESSDQTCSTDLNFVIKKVSQNYAGYESKTKYHQARLHTLSDSLISVAGKTHDFKQCTDLIWSWLGFFNDGHLWQQVINKESDQKSTASKEQNPSLSFLDSKTAYFRIPSFKIHFKPKIDSLLQTKWNKLMRTRNLIIDVRGNGGGSDASFTKLLPLLYTGPYKTKGIEVRVTEDNIKHWESLLKIKEIPDSHKQTIKNWINKMRGHEGSFVTLVKNGVTRRDTTYRYPKQVAVLIDGKGASSTESFLLNAQNSNKVTLIGKHTYGAIDYANLNMIKLPSGMRRVGIPTTRSKRLPENPIDKKGMSPDVVIPKDTENWVSFTRGYLNSKKE